MIPRPANLVLSVLEHFLQAQMHDVREQPPGRRTCALPRRAWQREFVAIRHQRLERRTVLLLQALRVELRHLQAMDDIVRHMPTGTAQ